MKKKIKVLLIALLLVLAGAFFTTAYAADGTRSLGAQMERPFEPKGKYQYAVNGETEGSTLWYTVVKIFDNIYKDFSKYTKPIYCLRGGKGFGLSTDNPETDVSKNAIEYIQAEKSEMHENAEEVIAKYNELYNVNLDRDIIINKKTVNIYNAILWILDESYLPKDKVNSENKVVYSSSEYKQELLDKAGVPRVQQEDITDNDLEVIQQLAIWYFANYDEQKSKINPTVSQSTMFPAQFLYINGNNNIDNRRANNLDRIYQYLVYGAINNSSTYIKNETTGARTKEIKENKFDKTKTLTIKSNDSLGIYSYYEIGPVIINSNARTGEDAADSTSIVLYDAQGDPIPKLYLIPEDKPISGMKSYNVIYKFVDSDGKEVETLKAGMEYSIRFYKFFEKGSNTPEFITDDEKYDVSKINIRMTSSYTTSTATFMYAVDNASENQAVVEIDKEKVSTGDEITTKVFDLALRKFITEINGTDLKETRTPKIDTTTLINGIENRTGTKEYTATYTHPKNALEVETGNKVTYTIRIYNEGETDGTATEVTDYLPEGLEMVPASESRINTIYKWETTDGKIIKTDYLKDTIIKAFDKDKTTEENGWQKADTGVGGLYYADLQIECKVVSNVSAQDQKLRNIAEITADTGEDRDSEPNNVNKDSYVPPTDNSTYQQDDDDYENLILKSKEFDLALRKFITKIERANKETSELEEVRISSRAPEIKIKELKEGTSKTAKYIHPKDILSLKRGDIIYYTIRVYNEGELDGYATEVKDYLPEGLELLEGKNESWTQEGNTLTTTALEDKILLAYNRDTTSVEEGINWQKATDDESGLYYYDLQVVCKIKDNVTDGAILKNVAEISKDKSIPTDIDDRDSMPGNVYEDGEHTPGTEIDGYTPGEQDDDDFERVTVEPTEVFDLALRKYIVSVNEKVLTGNESRVPDIDVTPLKQSETTADYKHRKDPVEVESGDIVTYRFGVYNEGDIKGKVTEIIDYLPTGIEFDSNSNSNFIEYKESYTEEELQGKEYAYKIEDNKITILPINKEFLFELDAFNGEELNSNSINVKFKVTAKTSNKDQVLTNVATMKYTAVNAEINDRDSQPTTFIEPTAEKLLESLPGYKGNEENKNDLTDSSYHYKGQEDDDDFEKVIIKGREFDLSLRKYISAINGEELENSRVPQIDTSKLNTIDENTGKIITTATYKHSKQPLTVKKGDLVTYKIRIYNEGKRDGYATKVTDYLPEGLGFLYTSNGDINSEWLLPEGANASPLYGEKGIYASEKEVLKSNAYKKLLGENVNLADVQVVQGKDVDGDKTLAVTAGGRTGQTEIKATDLIKAYKSEKTDKDLWQQSTNDEADGLFYQELEITCIVLKENTYPGILKNVAEITAAQDSEGNEIKNVGDDRDSEPNNVYEDGKHTPGTEVDGYTPGEQDDDDFEPLQLKYFDLALRKFITKVDEKAPETSREPEVDVSTLIEGTYNRNGKLENTATYKHPKEPLLVKNGSNVEYTIRVYNEGTEDGYAYEIADDIPEGLIYDPENETNKEYGWVMYREIAEGEKDLDEKDIIEYNNKKYIKTTNAEEATMIRTRCLENKIIKAFNQETKELSYEDVKVAFIVYETENIGPDRVIINEAQITEDSGDDEDSTPNKWQDEDDEDIEKVRIPIFDLSLLKWVTKTTVTVDGKTTVTETGFKPNTGKTETTGIRSNEAAEPIAKVEVDRKKLDKTTVKFTYKIRVTNEGEIEGFATKITDFIPEGLEFREEDNKAYGWVKEGDNKVTTRATETVLLQPGESTEVEIVFTWKNGTNNLGLKTNIAEITEDYNDYNTDDIDSTPNNKKDPYEKEQEDDDDFALVILSIKTGKGASYVAFTVAMLTLLAGGIYLVKRYVLTY